jgi:hypothetical protein
MTPHEFCHQSLQVLRLPGATRPGAVGPYEFVLAVIGAEDLAPSRFQRQLWLLATSDVCPGLSGAAERVLGAWCAERDRAQLLARTVSRN